MVVGTRGERERERERERESEREREREREREGEREGERERERKGGKLMRGRQSPFGMAGWLSHLTKNGSQKVIRRA